MSLPVDFLRISLIWVWVNIAGIFKGFDDWRQNQVLVVFALQIVLDQNVLGEEVQVHFLDFAVGTDHGEVLVVLFELFLDLLQNPVLVERGFVFDEIQHLGLQQDLNELKLLEVQVLRFLELVIGLAFHKTVHSLHDARLLLQILLALF